jgi:hypothetical protein
MKITLSNGYTTDNLRLLNYLIDKQECKCCRNSKRSNGARGEYWGCGRECRGFVFSGVKETKYN